MGLSVKREGISFPQPCPIGSPTGTKFLLPLNPNRGTIPQDYSRRKGKQIQGESLRGGHPKFNHFVLPATLANVWWAALSKGASSWSVAIWAASMRTLAAVLNISQWSNLRRGVEATGHWGVRLPSKRQEIGAMIFLGLELVVSRATLDYSFISRNWKDNFLACRLLPAVTTVWIRSSL